MNPVRKEVGKKVEDRIDIDDDDRFEQEEDQDEALDMACGGYVNPMMGLMMDPTMDMMMEPMYVGEDEESGNMIPVGSTAENVKDDIPAMLSEGEYVLPADVVAWHGLKGILDMQQEARSGLMMMKMDGLIQHIEDSDHGMEEHEDEEDYEEDYETSEGNQVEVAEVVVEEHQNASCPLATQDLQINTKNRDAAIKADHVQYGPLNISEPGDYWEGIADHWDTTVAAAKESLCGNCASFDISDRMDDCMPGSTSDDEGVLGYCWMHNFKCHSARSCRTWAKGGPIVEDETSYEWQENAEVGDEDTRPTKSNSPSFKSTPKIAFIQ